MFSMRLKRQVFLFTLPALLLLLAPPLSPAKTFVESARSAMVERQIRDRGIRDPRVLRAMNSVPRHLFVPEQFRSSAYEDHPLPIGYGQTISQPYIVALMTETLHLNGTEKALEIGTGSGYQAAVLSTLCAEVYSIEIIPTLAAEAKERLESLGYHNVHVSHGDGYKGWPEHAPFDVIIVTAAPPEVPAALIEQLKVGGRMVIPVGESVQELLFIEKTKAGTLQRKLMPVRFVPMVRERK